MYFEENITRVIIDYRETIEKFILSWLGDQRRENTKKLNLGGNFFASCVFTEIVTETTDANWFFFLWK